eukprot:TRINITY_DN2404_c0_g2_i2.p1 TRINITY_DN2404_c0_g2~~TRINITY_DN2404_c0_g2_i2.p1  ORF type:complete len:183 (+),score=60.99 TRINITY_DN2404_c0_g2_i2:336-884(+)
MPAQGFPTYAQYFVPPYAPMAFPGMDPYAQQQSYFMNMNAQQLQQQQLHQQQQQQQQPQGVNREVQPQIFATQYFPPTFDQSQNKQPDSSTLPPPYHAQHQLVGDSSAPSSSTSATASLPSPTQMNAQGPTGFQQGFIPGAYFGAHGQMPGQPFVMQHPGFVYGQPAPSQAYVPYYFPPQPQ